MAAKFRNVVFNGELSTRLEAAMTEEINNLNVTIDQYSRLDDNNKAKEDLKIMNSWVSKNVNTIKTLGDMEQTFREKVINEKYSELLQKGLDYLAPMFVDDPSRCLKIVVEWCDDGEVEQAIQAIELLGGTFQIYGGLLQQKVPDALTAFNVSGGGSQDQFLGHSKITAPKKGGTRAWGQFMQQLNNAWDMALKN